MKFSSLFVLVALACYVTADATNQVPSSTVPAPAPVTGVVNGSTSDPNVVQNTNSNPPVVNGGTTNTYTVPNSNPKTVPNPSPPAGKGHSPIQPSVISVECSFAYMPFSQADLVAMLPANATDGPPPPNPSTEVKNALCRSDATGQPALCKLASCTLITQTKEMAPTCRKCHKLNIDDKGATTRDAAEIGTVACTENYFLSNLTTPMTSEPADVNSIKDLPVDNANICITKEEQMFSCVGYCTGHYACSRCVEQNDPAFASP